METQTALLNTPLNAASSDAAHIRVRRLFATFRQLFGAQLFSAKVGVDARAEEVWADVLRNFSDDEFMHGIWTAKEAEWMPTLSEFCRWCRPPQTANSTWGDARYQVSQNRPILDPLLYWLVQDFGGASAIKIATLDRAPNIWEAAFRARKAEQQAGMLPPIPDIPPMLEEKDGPPVSEETAKNMLHVIKGKAKSDNPCYTSWITRVFKRIQQGEEVTLNTRNLAIDAANKLGIEIPKQITGWYRKDSA